MRKCTMLVALAAVAALLLSTAGANGAPPPGPVPPPGLPDSTFGLINHFVVIYLENHSFDNLYGSFAGANGVSAASNTAQVNVDGSAMKCLTQVDPHFTSPPLAADACAIANGDPVDSHFVIAPFNIDQYLPANQKTIDLVRRFYQERVQIDGGLNDKFAAVSDAKGLSMGQYDTKQLPLAGLASQYTLADDFFQAAFGGSFLNHQWLICACTPSFDNAVSDGSSNDLHSVLDSNGLPVKDGALTAAPENFAVNTIQPFNPPYRAGTPDIKRLPPLTNKNIGDELSAAGLSWAWYSGGWDDAAYGTPDPLFQYHHQPFNYYANYAPGTPGRNHLQSEANFVSRAKLGILPAVSFVKPIGAENEHPGYADVSRGEQHTVDLVNAVLNGPNAPDTAIIITYDENGGFWDHIAPPVIDRWGPGNRVPALVVGTLARRGFVDHTQYDTTSILATIEHRWGLASLGTRDAAANDLRNAFIGARLS